MPPITHKPSSKRITGRPNRRRIARPLEPRLVDEEARDLVAGSRRSGVDLDGLPLGVEGRVGDHDETPGELVAEIEELVVDVAAGDWGGDVGCVEEAFDADCGVSGEDDVALASAYVVA